MKITLNKKIGLPLMLFIAANLEAATLNTGATKLTAVNPAADGNVYLNTSSVPSGTCFFWAFRYRFDGRTAEGKNMLAAALAAMVADKPVAFNYNTSTTPDTNHYNGCVQSTMAVALEMYLMP